MSDYREILGVSGLAGEADSGAGVRVAVIDTGIPTTDEVPVSLAENFTSDDGFRDSEHSTALGSILFGHGPVGGICPKATSCFAKVFSGKSAAPATVASAIDYAVGIWKADVINLSLGFSGSEKCPGVLRSACRRAEAAGAMVVASAGNDGGRTMWPAALPGVLSVGASDGRTKEDFSNSGKTDVVAPGAKLPVVDADGSAAERTGTSYSTAIISGLLALLLARRRRREPEARAADVKDELIGMCVDIGPVGKDRGTGHGFPFPGIMPDLPLCTRLALSLRAFFATINDVARKAVSALHRPKSKETRHDE